MISNQTGGGEFMEQLAPILGTDLEQNRKNSRQEGGKTSNKVQLNY
jgi:hypothetical protein